MVASAPRAGTDATGLANRNYFSSFFFTSSFRNLPLGSKETSRSFLSVVTTSSRLAAGAEWLKFEDAVVYRWTSASVSGELTCGVSRDELKQFWEVERKMMSLKLPALLIDVDKRQVTLRFHPRQGPQGDIGSVKRPFEFALHRPNARPDCQINWLN